MKTKLRWARRVPNSANNFDLVLTNSEDLDIKRIESLIERILKETHRGLTLSSHATDEFRRWINDPSTPLRSTAYVLLSNWFMTQSGDRNSMVATCCETLWDELFPCRPAERLSSPEAGRNHAIKASEFASFWQKVLKAQGDDVLDAVGPLSEPIHAHKEVERPPMGDLAEGSDNPTPYQLRATFHSNGLHFEVEGHPRALADFLRAYGQSPALPEESR